VNLLQGEEIDRLRRMLRNQELKHSLVDESTEHVLVGKPRIEGIKDIGNSIVAEHRKSKRKSCSTLALDRIKKEKRGKKKIY
jgi:hypothetical protein